MCNCNCHRHCCCCCHKTEIIGVPGATGANGTDGLSAYEIAEKEGYIGTEEEWLASLKGDKGDKGDPGSGASDIRYLYAQSQNHANEAVSKIPFDTPIFDDMKGAVEIDKDNYIVYHEHGLYKIDWQLSYDDPNLGDGDLKVLYAVNNGPYTYASYRSNKGFISGSIVLDTNLAGVIPLYTSFNFRDINHDVPLGNTQVQTNITILKLK